MPKYSIFLYVVDILYTSSQITYIKLSHLIFTKIVSIIKYYANLQHDTQSFMLIKATNYICTTKMSLSF